MTEALLLLPLFPLSNVVLFPGVRVPLHVFEPRYRQMVRDALEGERRIGMIAVRPEHDGEMAGDPPLFEVGCLGEIVESQALPDGRFQIVLHGEGRFRLRREPPREGERLYRVGEVERLAESQEITDVARLHALRGRIIELFGQVAVATAPDRAEELTPSLFESVSDALLANSLCQILELSTLEKQGLLEANGLVERCEQLCGVLEFRVAELAWQQDARGDTRH